MLRFKYLPLLLLTSSPAVAMEDAPPQTKGIKRLHPQSEPIYLLDEIWDIIIGNLVADPRDIATVCRVSKPFYTLTNALCARQNKKYDFIGWPDAKGEISSNPGRIFLENQATYRLLSFYQGHYLEIQGYNKITAQEKQQTVEEFTEIYRMLPASHPTSEVFSYVNYLLTDTMYSIRDQTLSYIDSPAVVNNPLIIELQGIALIQEWQEWHENCPTSSGDRNRWGLVLNNLLTTKRYFGLEAALQGVTITKDATHPVRLFLTNYCTWATNTQQLVPIFMYLHQLYLKGYYGCHNQAEPKLVLDNPLTVKLLNCLENHTRSLSHFRQEMVDIFHSVPEIEPYFLRHFPELSQL